MVESLDHRKMAEISSGYSEVLSPVGVDQLRTVGRIMGLGPQTRAVDFGCGYAEALRIWVKAFGINAVGIENHAFLCNRARVRLSEEALVDRVRIVEADAKEWENDSALFDVAACIGADGIWGGFEPAICNLKKFMHAAGRILIGSAYYLVKDVPQALVDYEGPLGTADDLLKAIHSQGCELEYISSSTSTDWERYIGSGWHDLLKWLDDNPEYPERSAVIERLHRGQKMYVEYRSKYEGFALYVLRPHRSA